MSTFIEDYILNPSQAIMSARQEADRRFSNMDCTDNLIYAQMASPEFRLYEQITLS